MHPVYHECRRALRVRCCRDAVRDEEHAFWTVPTARRGRMCRREAVTDEDARREHVELCPELERGTFERPERLARVRRLHRRRAEERRVQVRKRDVFRHVLSERRGVRASREPRRRLGEVRPSLILFSGGK